MLVHFRLFNHSRRFVNFSLESNLAFVPLDAKFGLLRGDMSFFSIDFLQGLRHPVSHSGGLSRPAFGPFSAPCSAWRLSHRSLLEWIWWTLFDVPFDIPALDAFVNGTLNDFGFQHSIYLNFDMYVFPIAARNGALNRTELTEHFVCEDLLLLTMFFVFLFEPLHFVFHVARSSRQLLQHLHAKANCLAPAGLAAIPVHLHPRPSVTVEAHLFLRPVLCYCITPILPFSFSSKMRMFPVLRTWPTRILEGGPVAIARFAASINCTIVSQLQRTNQICPFFLSLWRSCQLDVTMMYNGGWYIRLERAIIYSLLFRQSEKRFRMCCLLQIH